MIASKSGAGNNWAKGYYSEGCEIIGEVLERIRQEAEIADCMQGFQLTHSIGGGTGSGFGSMLLNKLSEEYSSKILFNFSVLPGSSSELGPSDVVVEPYNALLSLNSIVENSHLALPIENSSLYRICTKNLGMKEVSFADINYLIAQAMSNATATMRFPGMQNNSDIRKICTNLIPFPRLHLITQGQAPLVARGTSKYITMDEKELT